MADETANTPTGEQPKLAEKTIGERIREVRTRSGKTRPMVAGIVGRSAEWLKAIEEGRNNAPGVDMLLELGRALGVRDLTEITGDHELLIGINRRAAHPVVPSVRAAIEEVELAHSAPTVLPAELNERMERAWRLWHTSSQPRADAGAMLPGIIRDGRRAIRTFDGEERRAAATALAGAYALSEQVLSWVADAPLLWLAADRCMAAAQIADRPNVLAAAAWVVGNVWRSTSREEDAWQLAQDAVALLEPRLEDDQLSRALWGSCQLHSAITAARVGREGDALRCLDQAMAMAKGLPVDYAHPWTLFGTANAELTSVSVQVDLRKSRDALEAAAAVDPDSIRSVDRRSRLYLEGARAYRLGKDWTGALGMLSRATAISEESMRHHPLSRRLASELVFNGGRLIEREARVLARRLGVTA